MGRAFDGTPPAHRRQTVLEDAKLGDSIAVDGCCLTVVDLGDAGWWEADVSDETARRTTLGDGLRRVTP